MKGNKFRLGLKPKNAFQPGHTTWNAGMKGVHFSPATEFKPGHKPTVHYPVGSVRIRFFRRPNEHRAFVKIAEPNIWRLRARVVWETANGPIPKGNLVHHNDRDTLNDVIGNLSLETRASHLLEHRGEFEGARLAALRSRKKSQHLP